MAPIAARFQEVGSPQHLAKTWFAGLLRDGFALTVGQANPSFASLGAEGLRVVLSGMSLNRVSVTPWSTSWTGSPAWRSTRTCPKASGPWKSSASVW